MEDDLWIEKTADDFPPIILGERIIKPVTTSSLGASSRKGKDPCVSPHQPWRICTPNAQSDCTKRGRRLFGQRFVVKTLYRLKRSKTCALHGRPFAHMPPTGGLQPTDLIIGRPIDFDHPTDKDVCQAVTACDSQHIHLGGLSRGDGN
jgi:hypothetical protein